MNTRFLRILIWLIWLCCSLVVAQQKPRMLSVADARHLVYEALSKGERKLPGLYIAPESDAKGRALAFEVLWANPGPGSVHVDFYTVDLHTGALWRGTVCEPVVTSRVVRIQHDLRKRLGITEKAYQEALEQNLCLK